MRFFKDCSDGIIYTIGKGACGSEISETEYNNILSIIRHKPLGTETVDYRLREDLTWEEYIIEPFDSPEETVDDKAEAYDILIGEKQNVR